MKFMILVLIVCNFIAASRAEVDPSDGSVYELLTYRLQSKLGAFDLNLYYSSRKSHEEGQGLFGAGWCSDLETKLELGSRPVVIICGRGRRVEPNSAASHFPSLQKVGTQYQFLQSPNEKWVFDSTGTLVEIHRGRLPKLAIFKEGKSLWKIDFGSKRFRVKLGKEGRIESLGEDGGKTALISFLYDNRLLTEARDVSGSVRVKYTSTGKIAEFKGNGKELKYEFDSQGLVQRIIDRKSNCTDELSFQNQALLVFTKCASRSQELFYSREMSPHGHVIIARSGNGDLKSLERRDIKSYRLSELVDSSTRFVIRRSKGQVLAVEQDGVLINFERKRGRITGLSRYLVLGKSKFLQAKVDVIDSVGGLTLKTSKGSAQISLDKLERIQSLKDSRSGDQLRYLYGMDGRVSDISLNGVSLPTIGLKASDKKLNVERMEQWADYASLVSKYQYY